MPRILYKTLLIIVCINTLLIASETGKIRGRIIDYESGYPLVGANVILKTTYLGAATDMNGEFNILNIPPDNYTMRITMLGYADLIVNNVEVSIDLTTQLNLEMSPQTLELTEVIVTAKRPLIIPDISASQLNIDSETIDNMPIQSVDEVVTLQSGIERGKYGIRVRGGGENQTVFMVDGFSQNDERSNYPYSAVSLSALDEIQVQTGGFNAEYGQARSGVINVITYEGSKSTYNGIFNIRFRPPGKKHFGPSIYDRNSYFNRPYFDPDVMWVGTQYGGWDTHTQAQYYKFEGWNMVSEKTLEDDDPDNDLTPDGAKRLFEWYHRRQGDIKKPDYIIDFGFGGPVPYIGEKWGDLRFYLSHKEEQEMFVFPLSRDSYQEKHTQIKVTADVSPAIKMVLTGLTGTIYSVSPYDWTTTPTGYVLRNQEEIANLTNSSSGGRSIPYMPGYFSPSEIVRNFLGLKFINTISSKTFYEVKLQYKKSYYNTYKTTNRDMTKRYEAIPGFFVDEAPFGYSASASPGPGGVHLGGWMNLGRDSTENSTTSLRFDYTSQINFRNQIKSGVEIVYNDYNIKSSTVHPANNFWNRSMIYRVFPFRIGTYLQDKLEYKGFIANAGVRLDYSDANTKKYKLSDYDPFYNKDLGDSIEEDAPSEDSKPDLMLSPRLGISHPITENSKLYFNYGHFGSEPFSSYRFRIQRESAGNVKYIGNPNLGMEKTISYELGYEHNLLNIMVLKIAGYYKDVSDQPGWILYRGLSDVNYRKSGNNNYEDIRGIEFTISKKLGNWISGFVNYTYDVRTSGYFGLLEYNEDFKDQRDYERKMPDQTRRHPRPYTRANLNINTPRQFGPGLIGIYPLENWNLNILADWKTGQYETYNPYNLTGVVDDVQWRDWYNVDIRISKSFRMKTAIVNFYIDVSNLFNYKYMREAGFADAIDRENYLASLRFPWKEGIEKGNDRFGDYRENHVAYDPLESNPDNDPEIEARNKKRIKTKSYIDMPNITSFTFLNPCAIAFGIRVNF